MSYPKAVKSKIDKYLNAVRAHMQDTSGEEVDEVILHLREQIDTALAESREESKNIKCILSTMPHPESFASSHRDRTKPLRWGAIAILTAVVSWAFNLGLIPWFSLYGIVWILLVAIATLSAVMSHKILPGKVALAILILEAISLPILHIAVQSETTSLGVTPAPSIESTQE